MTDQEFDQCIIRMQRGEKEALKEVYQDYLSFVYAIALDILKNKENAEDVTSDFFIKIWNISNSYRPGNGHKAWMARIIKNMAIDFLRKHKKEVLMDILEDASGESETESYGRSIYGGDSKSVVEEEVMVDMSVEEALAVLNSAEREIITLKIMGDMTFKEIAALLDQPMGTVTWKYQNAIKKLRRCGYE